MLLLILSISLYIIPSILLCRAIFRGFSLGEWLITFFISLFGLNILIFQILHFFHAVNQPWSFLIIQAILCIALSAWCIRKDGISYPDILSGFRRSFSDLGPLDFILIGMIVLILGGFFYVGITTPINNLDSLRTHLTRIFY